MTFERPAMTPTLSPAAEDDVPTLRTLVAEAGLVPPEHLPERFAARLHGGAHAPRWRVARDAGAVVGFAYAEPELYTNGAWNLRALAVQGAWRRRGVAQALLAALEAELRRDGARVLVVDTSDAPDTEPARALYRRQGYGEGATIPEFWGPGEAKVTVWKRL